VSLDIMPRVTNMIMLVNGITIEFIMLTSFLPSLKTYSGLAELVENTSQNICNM